MVMAGSGDMVSSHFIMSICVQLVRYLGILLVRALLVHHEEHVALQQLYVDVRCPAEKACHLAVEEMVVARG